jgi:hypothetical protein
LGAKRTENFKKEKLKIHAIIIRRPNERARRKPTQSFRLRIWGRENLPSPFQLGLKKGVSSERVKAPVKLRRQRSALQKV